MAGSTGKIAEALNILLVRHGESVNNPLHDEIFFPVMGEPPGSSRRIEAEAQWLARRSDDPALTSKGLEEAEQLSNYYAPLLEKAVGPEGRVHLFVSPFLRTCQTAAPLARRLGAARCRVAVRPDLFEVGGVYTAKPGQPRGGPGQCLSAEDIEQQFQGFDTSAVMAGARDKGWYIGGWESDAEGRERAAAVSEWLKSRSLVEECASTAGDSAWAVLVMHGHFIDLLVKALIGRPDDASEDIAGTNTFLRQVTVATPNTAVGRLSVISGGRVIVHYLGRTDHLGPLASL